MLKSRRHFPGCLLYTSYQGASEGTPRNVDKPQFRTEDIHGMADYISAYPGVDTNHIGALGICGGGGYTLNAAKSDKRFKAVATLSMFNSGQVRRNGFMNTQLDSIQTRLKAVSYTHLGGDVRKKRVIVSISLKGLVLLIPDGGNEVKHGRGGNGELGRRVPGKCLYSLEVFNKRMTAEADFGDDFDGFRLGLTFLESNGALFSRNSVSYTHLDVYKRQPLHRPGALRWPILQALH